SVRVTSRLRGTAALGLDSGQAYNEEGRKGTQHRGADMDNQTIADRLTAHANYLDAEDSNVYRVRAYRRAAETVRALDRPVADIVAAEGRAGLDALPGIGSHLAYTIE